MLKGLSSAALGTTAAITGGAIDGTPIGASDPSTGAFTTLEGEVVSTDSTFSFGAVEYSILGTATVDLTSTTAVKIGTTPNNGKRFIPLFVVALCTAASAPADLASATLGIGQTGAGYTDWMLQFLDASFDTANEMYQWPLPRTATAILSAPANTDIFAKVGTTISGGTMTIKVAVIGICI